MLGKKLINKLKRRQRYLREKRPFIEKLDKAPELMARRPGLQKAMLMVQRRLDEALGYDSIPSEPLLEVKGKFADLLRMDFGSSDFGILATIDGVGAEEETEITTVADNGGTAAVAQELEVTCVADVAGSLAGLYWTFSTPEADYYVWYEVDAVGVDPEVADHIGIKVEILEDATDAQVAAASEAAIELVADVDITTVDEVMTIVNDTAGDVADPDEATSGFTIVESVAGSDAGFSLNSKYFLFNTTTTAYYVWFNVDAAGVDPEVAGRDGVEVAISEDDSAAAVATALEAALEALPGVSSSVLSNVVSISLEGQGAAADAQDGDDATTFTFDVTQQGSGAALSALMLREGDVIELLDGDLAGQQLKVEALIDQFNIRLEDVATFTSDSDSHFRTLLSAVKKSYY